MCETARRMPRRASARNERSVERTRRDGASWRTFRGLAVVWILRRGRGVIPVIVGGCLVPTSADAQHTNDASPLAVVRTNEPQSRVREQATDTTPPVREGGITAWFRRRARSFGASADESTDGFSADAGVITAGAGLGAGVGYRHSRVLSSGLGIEADAMVSYRRYQAYRVAVGVLGARRSTVAMNAADTRLAALFNDAAPKAPGTALYADVRFRDYPRHMYFGTSMASNRLDRSDYALTGLSYEGVLQKQIRRTFGVSLRGGVLDLDVGTGRDGSVTNLERRFNLVDVPGALTSLTFFTVGAGFVYDTRPEPRAPEAGGFVGMALRRFHGRSAADLSFTRVTLDARTYRRPSPRGVVAVRGLLSGDVSSAGGATPFYLQESLGGGETLRGFRPLRFQHRALLHGTVEYRWRVHRFVEVAPFADAGTMASTLSSLGDDAWRFSGGIGVRARTDRRMIVRLDWARSGEGQRLILAMGPFF